MRRRLREDQKAERVLIRGVVLVGALLPWCAGLWVKLHLDWLGEPTLRWIDILAGVVPLVLWAGPWYALPSVLLAVYARYLLSGVFFSSLSRAERRIVVLASATWGALGSWPIYLQLFNPVREIVFLMAFGTAAYCAQFYAAGLALGHGVALASRSIRRSRGEGGEDASPQPAPAYATEAGAAGRGDEPLERDGEPDAARLWLVFLSINALPVAHVLRLNFTNILAMSSVKPWWLASREAFWISHEPITATLATGIALRVLTRPPKRARVARWARTPLRRAVTTFGLCLLAVWVCLSNAWLLLYGLSHLNFYFSGFSHGSKISLVVGPLCIAASVANLWLLRAARMRGQLT
jgi:hypothetical protein